MSVGVALSEEAIEKAGAVELTGVIKWFDAVKGYGFLLPNDENGDVLIHYSILRELGRRSVPEPRPSTASPAARRRASPSPLGFPNASASP